MGLGEYGSKNTLARFIPVKIVTDVKDGRTSEDGSPRTFFILASNALKIVKT